MTYGYVYRIINHENNKIYVGQAKDPERRKKQHFTTLKNDTHPNKMMQSDFKEFGHYSFEFEIIDSSLSQEDLNNLEKFYIDKYKSHSPASGYNIQEGISQNRSSLHVLIPKDLGNRVSDKALAIHGRKHGYLKRAVVEALELWLKTNE